MLAGGAFHKVVKKKGVFSSYHIRLHGNTPAGIHGEIHTFSERLFTMETTRSTLSTANRIYKNIFQGSVLPAPISIASLSTSMLDIYFEEREVCLSPTFGGTGSWAVAGGRNEEIYHPVLPEAHVAVFPPYNI